LPLCDGVVFCDMLTPIAFSDEQLDAIMHAAQPLAPADRKRFIEVVTAALQGRELGDGAVYLAIRKAQRQFFAPPVRNRPTTSFDTTQKSSRTSAK
jgi:hypothetical protein